MHFGKNGKSKDENSMDELLEYAGWDGLNIGMFTPIIRLKDKNQVRIEELEIENKMLQLKLEHERIMMLYHYSSSITHLEQNSSQL